MCGNIFEKYTTFVKAVFMWNVKQQHGSRAEDFFMFCVGGKELMKCWC